MTPKFHSLIISDITKETEDTVSIAFTVPEGLQSDYKFLSGQYLTFKVNIEGEEIRRSYSLCSAPHEKELRVAVKQVLNGKFSTYANTDLKPGLALDVMTPTGNFVLDADKNNSKSYVLFASGSGITPILSIIKTALVSEPNSNITLFFGNKGFSSVIFREEIEALKNQFTNRMRVVHLFSRETIGSPIQKGRIDTAKVEVLYEAFLKNTAIDAVYVCGPEQMISDVQKGLISKGVDKSKIHYELFTTPSSNKEKIELPRNSPKIESNITVIIDGDQVHLNLSSTGQSVLDAAIQAGADLPFACKGGVCCTCKAKIIEGSVSMDANYSLEVDEVEAGFILSCQSHPTSDKLVISFDE